MSRLYRSILAFVFLLAALATVPAQGSAAETKQWSFTPTTSIDRIAIATPYAMTNSTGGFFGVGSGGFGIDLRFGTTSGGRFSFHRVNVRDHRTLKAYEAVALFSTAKGRYLAYGPQPYGVDLRWSTTPRYEWKAFTGQDSLGQVRTEVYNVAAGGFLIRKPQMFATDLGFQRGLAPGAAF